MEIIIRIYKGRKVIRRLITQVKTKWRKLYAKLASAVGDKYLVRVNYGLDKDIHGKRVMFYNEYEGREKQEAKQALSAFLE